MDDMFCVKVNNNTGTGVSIMPGDHIVVSGRSHEFNHFFLSPLRIRVRRNDKNGGKQFYILLGSQYNYDVYYEQMDDYVGWRLAIKNTRNESVHTRRTTKSSHSKDETINITIAKENTLYR
ncbi:MAG: hypothetical protein GY940_00125 [bacterium]|nr:hypothetical protein [bacterium]